MTFKNVLLLGLIGIFIIFTSACNVRKTESGIVCVCNSTYCDKVPDLKGLTLGQYQLYFTGETNPGFNTQTGSFSRKQKKFQCVVKINTKKRHQKIIGFGGAFTDATGINLKSLNKAVQDHLMESYFGKSGIEYSVGRVPIGGVDFSTRPYTYDDYPNDTKLEHFKLQEEDLTYKIPLINEAKMLRGENNLKLLASAWTAPTWMKTADLFTGYSLLREEYYQLWTDYTLKFFEQYNSLKVNFWGLTTGNEPIDGFISGTSSKIPAMGWVPKDQIKWLSQNLGPSIRKSEFKNLKIIIHDDARITIPYNVPLMLSDDGALKYIDGIGVHWYWDDRVPADVLSFLKTDRKEVFLLATESCIFREGIELGSWDRAVRYIESILEYLENDFGGWMDWNMALSLSGGPTYIGYESDSPILVNASSQEFYKQPLFYAMGHFSKFIVPDSIRLDITQSSLQGTVKTMAFLRPDNMIAVILFNKANLKSSVQIQADELSSQVIEVGAKSMNTVLFPVKRT